MQKLWSFGELYNLVIVHSFSRIFREAPGSVYYSRLLGKHGLKAVSITQETGEGPKGELMRQILSSFDEYDEYHGAEIAKHVTRSMLENARRGYWRIAAGKTIVAEHSGNKDKKKLATEVKEAELVKLMFRLYLHGRWVDATQDEEDIQSQITTMRAAFASQTVEGLPSVPKLSAVLFVILMVTNTLFLLDQNTILATNWKEISAISINGREHKTQ